MLKKYLILAFAVICNIQSIPLNPDVYQSHKDLVNSYKANLRKLNSKIENNTATAADILSGINLCRQTIENLTAGAALPKNKHPFLICQNQLFKDLKKTFPHLTLQ
jgi:hypothetical protein